MAGLLLIGTLLKCIDKHWKTSSILSNKVKINLTDLSLHLQQGNKMRFVVYFTSYGKKVFESFSCNDFFASITSECQERIIHFYKGAILLGI